MTRRPRPPVPAWAEPMLASFRLHLAAYPSPKTRSGYLAGARFVAGWVAHEFPGEVTDWAEVKADHIRAFFERGLSHCTQSSRNSIGRAVQAWWRWWSKEEELPNPMTKVKVPPAPRLGSQAPPLPAREQIAALIADAEKTRGFENLRDAALLRMFGDTGARLAELAELDLDQVDYFDKRRALVTGKGDKQRWIKFGQPTAKAIDRYVRARAKHKMADIPALWLPLKANRERRGLTGWGVRQIVRRRGERLGLHLWPHLFRHAFAHNWLAGGGEESDLLELAGWESAQMLKVYGRSARSARAQSNYDRVMGG